MKLLRPLIVPLLLAITPALGGCGALLSGKGGEGSPEDASSTHPGVSDESCVPVKDRIEQRQSGPVWVARVEDPAETTLRLMACAPGGLDRLDQSKKMPSEHWHQGFQDRPWDTVTSALIVVSLGRRKALTYDIAMGALHAERVEPAALREALASMDLPGDVKEAFAKQYEAARQVSREKAARLKGREDEKALLEIPPRVVEERQAYFKKYAQDLEAFDALAARVDAALRGKTADAALLQEAVALRDRHVTACAADPEREVRWCWRGPITWPLTLMIRDLAVAARDPLRAEIERSTLRLLTGRGGVVVDSLVRALYAAQTDGGRRSVDWIWMPPLAEPENPELDGVVGDSVVSASGTVERITEKGDATTFHFKTFQYVRIKYKCVSWGKEWQRNVWKEWKLVPVCLKQEEVSREPDIREAAPDITVPAAEARSIKVGDVLDAYVMADTRRGFVHRVSRKLPGKKYSGALPLAQIRFMPLPDDEIGKD